MSQKYNHSTGLTNYRPHHGSSVGTENRNGSKNRYKIKNVLQEILHKYGGLKKDVKTVGKLLGCTRAGLNQKKYELSAASMIKDAHRRSLISRFSKKKKSLVVNNERSRLANNTFLKEKASLSCERITDEVSTKSKYLRFQQKNHNQNESNKTVLGGKIDKDPHRFCNISLEAKERPVTNYGNKKKASRYTMEASSQKSYKSILNVTRKTESPETLKYRITKGNDRIFVPKTVKVKSGLSKNKSSKHIYRNTREDSKRNSVFGTGSGNISTKMNKRKEGILHRSVCANISKGYKETRLKLRSSKNQKPINHVNISLKNPEFYMQKLEQKNAQSEQNSLIDKRVQFLAVSDAPSVAYNLPKLPKQRMFRYKS
ncbi:unnamed protein product [Moneuplotes crassus]|uniref:Uncharacterized protein n=1 Tax=Euplotes crassus TaxID=5936 RepID=A0AAD1U3V9_EUPCR|nr:unnamed protein product [Moneuplotes crassus]